MGSYHDPELTGRQPRRWLVVLAVLVALAVGVDGGYLLRYATTGAAAPTPVASPPPATTQQPPANVCTRAADLGAALLAQLQQGMAAISRLDPQGLQRVLEEVTRLQGGLRHAVDECRGLVSPPAATPGPGG